MQEYLERTFSITSSEVDIYGNCRPAAFLSFFQDLATEHSEIFHTDWHNLFREYHAIWMLVRVWYQIRRPLNMGEELTIRTWQRGTGGLIVYRDFDLYVGEEQVGEAVSAWVVADAETRKMLRPGSLERLAAAPVPEQVKEKQLKLIRTPKNRKLVYTRTVRYSDLDQNGHMNNTKYADVLMDALSVADMKGRFVSAMQLNYSMECLAGETMNVSRELGENACYIDGCSEDGTRRFEAILQFRPDSGSSLDGMADYE